MDARTPETLGQRIARLREAAKLTQEQLAEKAGFPVTSLRNWEHDHRRPRADAALLLAQALEVTVEILLQAPSDRPSRAEIRETLGLRALKRAWERADAGERRQFMEFVQWQAEKDSPGHSEHGPEGREARGRRKKREGS